MNSIKIYFTLAFGLFFLNSNAQIFTAESITPSINGSNVLIDGSSAYSVEAGSGPNVGKGIIIPSVDLVNFEFDLTFADGSTFPTFFDGMFVYNNAGGTTLTSGNRSSTATVVAPGFYYYSNLGGFNEYNNVSGDPQASIALGVWTPMGGAAISSTSKVTLTDVAGDGVSTLLDLDTSSVVGTLGTVTRFIDAKVYDATGLVLQMTASTYDIGTKVLTTGNGALNTLLPVGDYTVVIEYE